MLKLLLFFILSLAWAEVILISGEIDSSIVSELKKATSKSKQILIYLSSNGGSFIDSYKFIKLMSQYQDKGYYFKCYAYKALSAAFNIFQMCDERIAFKNTELFQHELQINFKGSSHRFKEFYKRYEKEQILKNEIDKMVSDRLDMSLEKYLALFEDNVMSNVNVMFDFGLIDSIKPMDDTILDILELYDLISNA